MNHALRREVNERIVELASTDPVLAVDEHDFICECAAAECTETVRLTLPEYESVRAGASTFVVRPAPEHVVADLEDVVVRTERYWTVRNRGLGAAVAENLDPSAAA